MREKKIVKLYTYSELSEEAKAKARDIVSQDQEVDWLYEDFAKIGALMGFDMRQRRVKLMNGGHRYMPAIYYSGFSSQGDGACCEGNWRASDVKPGKVLENRPEDKELQRIASFFEFVAKTYPHSKFTVSHAGRYYHSGCTIFDIKALPDEDESHEYLVHARIKEEARAFMDWIYKQLETDYNYRNSDDAIAEGIRANEYEFTEDGKVESQN